MGQPKAAEVLSRRCGLLDVMAFSTSLSAGPAIRARFILPDASHGRNQRMARQARILEINGASPKSVSTPEMPVFGPIAT